MDRWIRRIDTVLILCMICYVVLFACPGFAGVRPVRVLSGSMAPKIQEGDMAYIKSCTASDARPGDVIAFPVGKRTDGAASPDRKDGRGTDYQRGC